MATTRTPFCGYNVAQCVELRGEDLLCCLNNIRSVGLRNVRTITSLPTKRTSAISQWKHLSEFYPQDGGESQLALKLHHCHVMYTRDMQPLPVDITRRRRQTFEYNCTQGRLNQWPHWARAQGPRIFSFWGAPTGCGEIDFLKLVILLLMLLHDCTNTSSSYLVNLCCAGIVAVNGAINAANFLP